MFDDAQRAHDAERVAHVHGGTPDRSEPDNLIEFCERISEWCVLVALIGNGQGSAVPQGREAVASRLTRPRGPFTLRLRSLKRSRARMPAHAGRLA